MPCKSREYLITYNFDGTVGSARVRSCCEHDALMSFMSDNAVRLGSLHGSINLKVEAC